MRLTHRGCFTLALALAATAGSATAQSPRPATAGAGAAAAETDRLAAAHIREHRVPGLSVAVMRNGAIVHAKGYGFANLEHRVPATPETIYQSGSVGKQFTAMLVMMLAHDERIGLDDPVARHIPAAPAAWNAITVRHLLTHTSGLSNRFYDSVDMRKDYSEDELVKLIAGLPLDFPPGEQMRYSNAGYVLLGVLIHRVTGSFYGEVLRRRIFAPLGMTTARIIDEAAVIPNRAAGYRLVNGEHRNQEWVAPVLNTTADGSLYLTVLDLAKWDAALESERLLPRKALEQAWTSGVLKGGKPHGYGFGWFVETVNGHRIVEHGGSWQGFTSHIIRSRDDGLTVVVLTNSAQGAPRQLAHGIAALHSPALRRDSARVVLDAAMLDSYVGDYALRKDLVLHVTREADTLFAQSAGQGRIRLHPETPTTFAVMEFAAKIEFVRGANGAVTGIILHQGGAHEGRKIR